MPADAYAELIDEITPPEISPIDPETDPGYLADRRRLLGPIADITHPEFGRENQPNETFVLVYDTFHPGADRYSMEIVQHIFDHAGVEVATLNDSDRLDQPSVDPRLSAQS